MSLPAAIAVTDKAIERIVYLLEKRQKSSIGIRVGVEKGGCSGLKYKIEYADEIGPYDEVVNCQKERQEIKILIDPKAIMYLIGSTMDFVEEKMQSGFTFTNPNEKGKCGCGESFNV